MKVKYDVSKAQIFGCAAYVRETKINRHLNLVQREKPGILLGHQAGMYRIFDRETEVVKESKNVKHDETKFSGKIETSHSEKHDHESENYKSLGYLDDLTSTLAETAPIEQKVANTSFGSSLGSETNDLFDSKEENKENEEDTQDSERISEPQYPRRQRFTQVRYVANAAR